MGYFENNVTLAALIVCVLYPQATQSRAGRAKTTCHFADSISQEGSDKYILWRSERPFPLFGYPTSQYNPHWMVFATSYHFRQTVLQFAHPTAFGQCQFLMKPDQSDGLLLSQPMDCHSKDHATLFSSTMGTKSRRTISFGSPQHPSHLYIGHQKRRLVLTSDIENQNEMVWWRISVSKTKRCPIML